MTVTEHERHHLFTWFEEHMGAERAATLMSLLPPLGWGDVATRRDLDERMAGLRHDLDERTSGLRRDIEALRQDVGVLRQDLQGLEQRLDHQIDIKLDAKLGQFRYDLLRTLGTWLFASQAAVIMAVSVLLALD